MDSTANRTVSVTDGEILDLFFARNESAIVETEKKYGRLFRSISYGITDSAEDALECVNDTYLKLWNSIPPERPGSLSAFGGRIVRNLSINRAKYNSAARRGGGVILEELTDSLPDSASGISEEGEIIRAVDSFLRKCDKAGRVAFIMRYWYCEPEDAIAKKLGCSVQSVKSRLFRMRKKLKTHLEKEGISL